MKLAVILLATTLFAAGPPPTELTRDQKDELRIATLASLEAEVEMSRLRDWYETERAKLIEKAKAANAAYTETVKKLAALAPPGTQLTKTGEFVAKPAEKKDTTDK